MKRAHVAAAMMVAVLSRFAHADCSCDQYLRLYNAHVPLPVALDWCAAQTTPKDSSCTAPNATASAPLSSPAASAPISTGSSAPPPTLKTAAAPVPAAGSLKDAASATAGSASDPKTDKNVFSGSPPSTINGTIKPMVIISGFKAEGKVDPSTHLAPKEFDFPAHAKFVITNDVIATLDGEKEPVEILYGRAKFDSKPLEGDPYRGKDDKGRFIYHSRLSDGSGPYEIREDVEYFVRRSAFASHENLRNGYTYGLLTAPYKFFPKDHSFSSSATIGPYAGWEFTVSDWFSAKAIGSFGLSSVPVTTTNSTGESTTSNKAALSLSTGVLFDINKQFQLGLLLGADSAGPNSGYQYNGKPWLAIDIGYKFSN
jgi:hypothetical protein